MKAFKKLLLTTLRWTLLSKNPSSKMDLDVQAELTACAQFPELDWSYCVDDNGTLAPPTWPPEVPLAAPPLRSRHLPPTRAARRRARQDARHVLRKPRHTTPPATALRGRD